MVLSQRFDVEPGVDSFQVYRALRTVNPSPYMFFLRFDPDGPLGTAAAPTHSSKKSKGSERPWSWLAPRPSCWSAFIRATWSTVPSPARARAALPRAEDDALAEEMLHDEKERSEHVMLVDLGRNDVGRVSRFGSVKVDKLMFVERYSPRDAHRQLHRRQTAAGPDRCRRAPRLLPCRHALRRAQGPRHGNHRRAEPARRGTYGGAVLYADFSGNLDSCIAIRSMLSIGGKGYVQAGAGIVADSVPELEHKESINKAQAVIRAIERAREM